LNGVQLGQIIAFGGGRGLGPVERSTLQLFSGGLAMVVNSVFLTERIQRLAHTDELTSLPNRRYTLERLRHEVERVERTGSSLAIAMLDVDHFKAVNDTYGHPIGDTVLGRVARALGGAVRTVDLVGRWGGEEFLAVLPFATPVGAQVVAERLRRVVEALSPTDGGPDKVTTSVGVAAFGAGDSAASLISRADAALYEAKNAGRNQTLFR
jgi:diguanylate cyclase (GGDEF)-like protein